MFRAHFHMNNEKSWCCLFHFGFNKVSFFYATLVNRWFVLNLAICEDDVVLFQGKCVDKGQHFLI